MRAISARLAAALVAAGTICSLTVTPGHAEAGWTTIATGLDNPRGLSVTPDGSVFVAEAGTGGPGPCFPGPEGGTVCFGTSGAVTKIGHGRQYRVLSGLPSLADPSGASAIGPSDVAVDGGDLVFTVGLGADPAQRTGFPEVGQQASGWLLRGKWRSGWRQVADLAGFEASANPDGGLPDSNPHGLLLGKHERLVADAGGNSLVRVAHDGTVSTVATFPDQLVEAPPFLGLPPGTMIPVQAVPTSVVRGRDGAYYVGTLTGFPFVAGAANVYRVVPGKAPTVYASGFTNIVDLAFDADGALYVLEIAHHGLASGDQTGALIKLGRKNSQRIVASTGLTHPTGVAITGRHAYVTNCGTCPAAGTVERIPLR